MRRCGRRSRRACAAMAAAATLAARPMRRRLPRARRRRARARGGGARIGACMKADYNRRMSHFPRARLRARGFTLIEIMVVIVILGVLAALVVPRVLERPDEARAVAAKSDIAAIVAALKLYRLD